MKQFKKGDRLRVGAVHNCARSGLDYNAQITTALEDGFSSGWDVWDVKGGDHGSIYGYSIIEVLT